MSSKRKTESMVASPKVKGKVSQKSKEKITEKSKSKVNETQKLNVTRKSSSATDKGKAKIKVEGKGKRKLRNEENDDVEDARVAKGKGKKKARIEVDDDDFEVSGGSISCRGNMNQVFDLILKKLSEKNLKAFKATCFGHLLEVPRIQFQGQLMFLLLNALDRSSSGSGSLSFRINDSLVKFGEEEFACITGLKLKSVGMLPSSSEFHKKVFDGQEKMFANDIRLRFLKECGDKDNGGDTELCLHLALLWVVYGLFTNRDGASKRIQVNLMHMLDDMDRFNNHPWGRVAFDFLEKNMFVAARSLDKQRGVERPTADVCGFSIPLQVWTYEILPKFARHCAAVSVADAFPRILRWTTTQFYQYSYICSFFTAGEGNTVQLFVLSAEEKEKVRELMLPMPTGVGSRTAGRIDQDTTQLTTDLYRIHEAILAMKREMNDRLDRLEDQVVNTLRASRESEVVATRKVDVEESIDRRDVVGGSSGVVPNAGRTQVQCSQETSNDQDCPVSADTVQQTADPLVQEKACPVSTCTVLEVAVDGGHEHPCQDAPIDVANDLTGPSQPPETNKEEEDTEQTHHESAEHICQVHADTIHESSDTSVQERTCQVIADIVRAIAGANIQEEQIPVCADNLQGFADRGLHETSKKALNDDGTDISFLDEDDVQDAKEMTHVEAKIDVPLKSLYARRPSGKKKKKKIVVAKISWLDTIMQGKYIAVREYRWPPTKPVYDWLTNNRGNDMASARLPTESKSIANVDWFDLLYKPHGWLGDDHCDVLLNMVIIYSKRFPDEFTHNWALVERLGTEAILSENLDVVIDRIRPFVDGNHPQQGGKPWKTIDEVYGIANIDDNHWILYKLNLVDQTILVFDSLNGDWSAIECTFVHAKKNLSKICAVGKVYENRAPKEPMKEEWDLQRMEEVPQQMNLADCGVMAIKYLECLTTGTPLSAINPRRVAQYRKAFCVELYTWGQAAVDA